MIDRRTALGLLAVGVSSQYVGRAQQHLHKLTKAPENYRLQFFSESENAVIDRVAEMILPADSHSGGAHDARVSYFIDLIIANSPETAQKEWRERLAAFQSAAIRQFGGEFAGLKRDQQSALLDTLAANERQPVDPAGKFFVEMKKLTISAYYSSEIGLLKELGYKGNQVLSEFPSCAAPVKSV